MQQHTGAAVKASTGGEIPPYLSLLHVDADSPPSLNRIILQEHQHQQYSNRNPAARRGCFALQMLFEIKNRDKNRRSHSSHVSDILVSCLTK